MGDKHIVHLREGGRVIIEGDRVEVHLTQPFTVHRKNWICHFSPAEEVRRTLLCAGAGDAIAEALVEAFTAVPMVAHPEDDD
ncbi:MAG: hypothetical protein RLW68_01675 [Devosia marina]|uniref:hypothetical protein n=1 Tax=Devosia marina TaxID=2683198 RepID=UPI0032EB6B61